MHLTALLYFTTLQLNKANNFQPINYHSIQSRKYFEHVNSLKLQHGIHNENEVLII